jgi:hypothetical protein
MLQIRRALKAFLQCGPTLMSPFIKFDSREPPPVASVLCIFWRYMPHTADTFDREQ